MQENLNEEARLDAVHELLKIDFNNNNELQDIVELASNLCDKPIALITLLDENINWLKVRYGTSEKASPRAISFCQYNIEQDNVLIIPDATKDERFFFNPLVQSNPHLRFYAGAPLVLNSGLKVGSLCLFDTKPGTFNRLQEKTLKILSRQASFIMQLALSHSDLKKQMEEVETKNQSLKKIAFIQSHEIRQPLADILGLISLIREGDALPDKNWMDMLYKSSNSLDERIKAIVNETVDDKDLRVMRFNKMIQEIEDYAIILLDNEGNIENWNKGAEKVKGYTASEIIGKNFSIFYTRGDKDINRPQYLLNEAMRRGFARDEGWRVKKDGSQFWGSILITAIHNDKDEVVGFTKVTRDLTEKYKNRQKIQ